jgi:hypothetical protein
MGDLNSMQKGQLRHLIENPPPGSKIADAKNYGVDLRALYDNLQLTPTERWLKLCATMTALSALRKAGKLLEFPPRSDDYYWLLELEALMELKELTGAQ